MFAFGDFVFDATVKVALHSRGVLLYALAGVSGFGVTMLAENIGQSSLGIDAVNKMLPIRRVSRLFHAEHKSLGCILSFSDEKEDLQ